MIDTNYYYCTVNTRFIHEIYTDNTRNTIMKKDLHDTVKTIKAKLPRGYVALVKSTSLSSLKKRVTTNQIKNVFNGRSVDDDKLLIIIKASKIAIRKKEAEKKKVLRKMRAA